MIINTRPKAVSKKIIELFVHQKVECRHVHMSKIEFLSGTKKQQIHQEVVKNIHTFSNIMSDTVIKTKKYSKYYRKYMKYKMKYLNLKNSTSSEKKSKDITSGKLKYFTLKSNFN